MRVRSSAWLLIALLALAVAVRLGRVPLAWNYWAIDYLSYPLAHRDELAHGHVAWTRLTGLHPGLWSLIMATSGVLGGGVRAAWAFSLLCSVGSIAVAAAWLHRRAGPAAAALATALLALSPLHAHYGLELNNYPLYLLGSAVLAAGLDRGLRRDRVGLAFLGALLCLHGHLAGHALVGAALLLALARRRGRLIGALLAAEALASPILFAALRHRAAAGTFHNERPAAAELLSELLRLWPERFAPTISVAALTLAVLWLTGRALRDRERRDSALVLATLAVAGLAATGIGLLSGAAFVAQTPYWLQPSWALLTGAALGVVGLSRAQIVGLAALLTVWLVPAAERAWKPTDDLHPQVGVIEPPRWRTLPLEAIRHAPPAAPPGPAWAARGFPAHLQNREPGVSGTWWQQALIPGREGPRVRSLPPSSPDGLRAWLEQEHRDVLLWIWEPAFANDDPRGWDPLFVALKPSEFGDLRPVDEPWPGFCRDWRGGAACFLNRASLRGGEFEAELRAALRGWIDAGTTVDLVFANLDPQQVPPDPRRLRQAVAEIGGTWTDEFVGVTWIARVRPP